MSASPAAGKNLRLLVPKNSIKKMREAELRFAKRQPDVAATAAGAGRRRRNNTLALPVAHLHRNSYMSIKCAFVSLIIVRIVLHSPALSSSLPLPLSPGQHPPSTPAPAAPSPAVFRFAIPRMIKLESPSVSPPPSANPRFECATATGQRPPLHSSAAAAKARKCYKRCKRPHSTIHNQIPVSFPPTIRVPLHHVTICNPLSPQASTARLRNGTSTLAAL
jgi:hypothetical protein